MPLKRSRAAALGATAAAGLFLGLGGSAAGQDEGPGWTVTCADDGACISHMAVPGLQILIGRGADDPDRLYAEIRVLPDAGVGSPLSIQVEDGWTGAMTVTACGESYCSLALDLDRSGVLVEQFRTHATARVAYLVDGAIVIVPLGLDGFSSTLDRLLQG